MTYPECFFAEMFSAKSAGDLRAWCFSAAKCSLHNAHTAITVCMKREHCLVCNNNNNNNNNNNDNNNNNTDDDDDNNIIIIVIIY